MSGTERDETAAHENEHDGEQATAAVGVAEPAEDRLDESATEADGAAEHDQAVEQTDGRTDGQTAGQTDDRVGDQPDGDRNGVAGATGTGTDSGSGSGNGSETHGLATDEDDGEEGAAEGSAEGAAEDSAEDDENDEEGGRRRPSWALTIALGAVAAVAVIALAVTAFVVPGWVVNPGSPDDAAGRAVTALALKNAGDLEAVSCHDEQGRTSNPFPPDALQLVQTVRSGGPTQMHLDTQALAPVDLVLSAQGQSQTFPADIVMSVTDGRWCMAGVSQRS